MTSGTLRRNIRLADGTGGASQGTTGRHTRFGLLLLLLMTSYVLSAFINGTWVSALQIGLFVGVTAIAVRSGPVKRGPARLAIAAAIGGSAIAVTLALTHSTDAVSGVAFIWSAFMLLFAVVLIVRRVIDRPEVSLQSIFGAVSAYMILGLMFAAIYAAMDRFGGSFFLQGASHDDLKTFQYFSFTTLTTLGYGDYTAAGSGGQAVAAIEALLGQVFLATLVARLVAAFRVPTRLEAARSARAAGRTDQADSGSPAGSGNPASHGHQAGPGHQARSGDPAGPGNQASHGDPTSRGDPTSHGGQASHGEPAGSGNPASHGGPAGPGHQGSPAQPAGPPPAATRISPRARARQARRSRLRPLR